MTGSGVGPARRRRPRLLQGGMLAGRSRLMLGGRRGHNFKVEECELLADGQMLKHIVVRADFERESEDRGEEQSAAHRAAGQSGGRLEHLVVAV